MADTVTVRATTAGVESFRKNGFSPDSPLPAASEIDLAQFDISDPEWWRRDAHWDVFARMRREDPVNWCPDSPYGPYWNITTYKDIMTIDTSIVGPDNLKSFEGLIRSRTAKLFDSLPVGEPFDWVDTVSIELTTMMLSTLFDFPFEDRRKLMRWSDVATGRNNAAIVTSEEQWRGELLECLGYFTQ